MWGKWFRLVLVMLSLVGTTLFGCQGASGPAKVTPEEEKQLQKQLEEAVSAEGRAGWGKEQPPSPPAPKK